MNHVYIVYEAEKWADSTLIRVFQHKDHADEFCDMKNNDNTERFISYYVDEEEVF